MEKVAISQMEAYMFETLRSKGLGLEEILNLLQNQDVSALTSLSADFDYRLIIDLYQKSPEEVKKLLVEGYQVKFLTLRGLYTLLELRFQLTSKDYQRLDNGLSKLQISESQQQQIGEMLSKNWAMSASENGWKITLR